MLRLFAHPSVTCCCVLMGDDAPSLKLVKLLATCKLAHQLSTLLDQQSWLKVTDTHDKFLNCLFSPPQYCAKEMRANIAEICISMYMYIHGLS